MSLGVGEAKFPLTPTTKVDAVSWLPDPPKSALGIGSISPTVAAAYIVVLTGSGSGAGQTLLTGTACGDSVGANSRRLGFASTSIPVSARARTCGCR